MSDTSKIRALILSVLMVTSVFAGAVALSGTAAAGTLGNVSVSASPDSPGETATHTVNVTADADLDGSSLTNFDVNTNGNSDVDYTGVTAGDVSITINGAAYTGNISGVSTSNGGATLNVVLDGSGQGLSQGDVIEATIGNAVNPTTSGTYSFTIGVSGTSTGTADLSVNSNGLLTGTVRQESNAEGISNALVTAERDSDGFTKNTTTSSDGGYVLSLPPGNYTLTANKTGFELVQPKDPNVESNKTTTADIVLRLLVNADGITAEDGSALADGEDLAQSLVTVTTEDGSDPGPLEGTTVEVTNIDNPSGIPYAGLAVGDTLQTDANGEAVFNATSTEPGSITVEFTATENGDGPTVSDTATLTFIPQSGEGEVIGEVFAADNPDSGLANATVYAVRLERALRNSISAEAPPTQGDAWFYRVRNNATGALVDYNDYRIDNNGQNAQLQIGYVRQLNESNASIGTGFAVINKSGTPGPAFVTPLEPGTYIIERSPTAPNASRFGNESAAQESFTAVKTVTVTEDLTVERARELANSSGAKLVDETDGEGKYVLEDLYADGQEGIEYLLVAEEVPEYERDYATPLVTEDGALFEPGEDRNFLLQPKDIEAALVNITQVGTHPPLAETGGSPDPTQITPFPAQGQTQADADFQRVSRDGTVDVMELETLTETGERINGSAVVELEEYPLQANLTGVFAVLGGTITDSMPGNEDAVTVNTGSDGVATVLYIADRSPDTVDVNKTATLTNAPTSDDGSNATFVGITEFESASISGILTDRDDTRVPESVAYVKQFQFDSDERFTFTPVNAPPEDTPGFGDWVEDQDSEFLVELQEFNTTSGLWETVNSETVTIETMSDYNFDEFENDFPSANVLSSVRAGSPATGWDFFDNTTAQADYTLDPLPASAEGGDFGFVSTDYRIEGVRINEDGSADDDVAGIDANDGLAEVQPNTTDDANLVFPFEVDLADFELSQLSAPSSATQGDNITVSATVSNEGGIQQNTRDVDFRVDIDGDGTLSADETLATQEVTLAPGTSDTVEFEVPTGDLAPDTYTHGFVVEGDAEVTGEIEITAGSGLSAYTNENGVVDDAGLSQAINDWVTGEIGDGLLSQAISAWVTGDPVD